MNNTEKVGGPVRNDAIFWNFRNMTENCKVKEIRSSGNKMSWAGWRDNIWVQCRLDRSFSNDAWFRLFPRAQMEYLEMWGSDHRPICINFAQEEDEPGRGRFYFYKRMLKKDDIEEVIRQSWTNANGRNNLSVMDRIKNCRSELARWKKSVHIHSENRIQSLKYHGRKRSRKGTRISIGCNESNMTWPKPLRKNNSFRVKNVEKNG